jgi:hypothetical protein
MNLKKKKNVYLPLKQKPEKISNGTPNFKYKITNKEKNDIDRFDLHSLDLCQLTSLLSGRYIRKMYFWGDLVYKTLQNISVLFFLFHF